VFILDLKVCDSGLLVQLFCSVFYLNVLETGFWLRPQLETYLPEDRDKSQFQKLVLNKKKNRSMEMSKNTIMLCVYSLSSKGKKKNKR
jgi:hypothetical protein